MKFESCYFAGHRVEHKYCLIIAPVVFRLKIVAFPHHVFCLICKYLVAFNLCRAITIHHRLVFIAILILVSINIFRGFCSATFLVSCGCTYGVEMRYSSVYTTYSIDCVQIFLVQTFHLFHGDLNTGHTTSMCRDPSLNDSCSSVFAGSHCKDSPFECVGRTGHK